VKWVDDLPLETISECFPTTATIPYDREFVDLLLHQTAARQEQIESFLKAVATLEYEDGDEGKWMRMFNELRTWFFTRSVGVSCINSITARRCEFYEACWNPVIAKDPIESGLYRMKEGKVDGDSEIKGSEE